MKKISILNCKRKLENQPRGKRFLTSSESGDSLKKFTSLALGAITALAIVSAPLVANAYPSGDVFRVEQTNTAVRQGYVLRVSGASVAKGCKVKFYQDINRSLAGAKYLGTKVAGRNGTTKSVAARTSVAGTFYVIAVVKDCPAMAKESRAAYAKFRVIKKR